MQLPTELVIDKLQTCNLAKKRPQICDLGLYTEQNRCGHDCFSDAQQGIGLCREVLLGMNLPCNACNLPLRSLKMARRALDLGGRKPQKVKFSAGRPDTERAVKTAEGPGIGMTLIPSSIAAFTKRFPGSLTRGVPALTRIAIPPTTYKT